MDKNYRELIEILKNHLEKNKNFIARLKELKTSDPIYRKVLNALQGIGSSKSDTKQQGIPTCIDSPHPSQPEEITIHVIIQDIKKKIDVVEEETEQVVKKLSEYYVSTTSKKEDVQCRVVQVYERDGNTSIFVTVFQERLHTTYTPDLIVNASKIDVKKPLLILCQARSRLIPDIDYSLELFTDGKICFIMVKDGRLILDQEKEDILESEVIRRTIQLSVRNSVNQNEDRIIATENVSTY